MITKARQCPCHLPHPAQRDSEEQNGPTRKSMRNQRTSRGKNITSPREMICAALACTGTYWEFSPFPSGIKYAEDHEQRLIALSRFPCFPSAERTVVIDRTTKRPPTDPSMKSPESIGDRFDAMFAIPTIAKHVRRKYRHDARFRWTSLELSEARSQGTAPFIQHWIKSIPKSESWSNMKTMILQVVWCINDNLRKSKNP